MGHHGHHHHWENHHRWHHHHGMRHGGMYFFPFIPLIIGLFFLFMIFKTGLWMPLLLIGAFMFFCRPRMGMGRGGWNSMKRGQWGSPQEWQEMREKMKRGWGQWQSEDTAPEEKPKRGNDGIEYV